MKTVRRWLIRMAMRTLRRLEWFPFTLLAALLFTAVRLRELRTRRAVVRIGRATEESAALPWRSILWLDRLATDLPSGSFDVCVRLPREAGDATLHDVFSVLLTSPRLASIGLYWDDAAMSDDQPLWQAGAACGANDIDGLSLDRLDRFFQAGHPPLDLPVAARREAQTLLKRLAGGASAICLNLPAEQLPLFETVVTAAPDVRFFDLRCPGSKPLPMNVTSLADYGLTLHERLAFVQAADAYLGSFDELGCAAIIGGRPGVLLGGGDRSSDGVRILSPEARTAWFPGPAGPAAAEWATDFIRNGAASSSARCSNPDGP
jgi:hypothetical protein